MVVTAALPLSSSANAGMNVAYPVPFLGMVELSSSTEACRTGRGSRTPARRPIGAMPAARRPRPGATRSEADGGGGRPCSPIDMGGRRRRPVGPRRCERAGVLGQPARLTAVDQLVDGTDEPCGSECRSRRCLLDLKAATEHVQEHLRPRTELQPRVPHDAHVAGCHHTATWVISSGGSGSRRWSSATRTCWRRTRSASSARAPPLVGSPGVGRWPGRPRSASSRARR